MATITIRNLEESIKAKLRLDAARHGCSMEEEARRILRWALTSQDKKRELEVESINDLQRQALLTFPCLPDQRPALRLTSQMKTNDIA